MGTILNTPESVRKLAGKLTPVATLKGGYEVAAIGYGLGWNAHSTKAQPSGVTAPSLVPAKAGDPIKMDRGSRETGGLLSRRRTPPQYEVPMPRTKSRDLARSL